MNAGVDNSKNIMVTKLKKNQTLSVISQFFLKRLSINNGCIIAGSISKYAMALKSILKPLNKIVLITSKSVIRSICQRINERRLIVSTMISNSEKTKNGYINRIIGLLFFIANKSKDNYCYSNTLTLRST